MLSRKKGKFRTRVENSNPYTLDLDGTGTMKTAEKAPRASLDFGALDALDDYDKALALGPDYAEAHHNRGNALESLGRDDEAIESCGRALAIDPV